ncbi:MAG: hypothetical protein LBD14_04420 [Puniceicoccales bacterium]|nr:hypothetical protein [Puniceicoccales bacterium]
MNTALRTLTTGAMLCAAASAPLLLLPGCASESPFKVRREIRETVVIELGAHDKLHVNGSSENPYKLAGILDQLGNRYPGRKVTLIMGNGSDEAAIPHIKNIAHLSGLGEVTVTTPQEIRKRAQAPAPEAGTAVAETPPAPPPPAATARALNPNVVTIEVSSDNEFKINGYPVSYEDFSKTLRSIGASNPGKPVEFRRAKDSLENAIFFVYKECTAAGLGKITSAPAN